MEAGPLDLCQAQFTVLHIMSASPKCTYIVWTFIVETTKFTHYICIALKNRERLKIHQQLVVQYVIKMGRCWDLSDYS